MAKKKTNEPLPLIDFEGAVFMKPPTGTIFEEQHACDGAKYSASYIVMCAHNEAGEKMYQPEDVQRVNDTWTLRDIKIARAVAFELCGVDADLAAMEKKD